MVKRRSGRREVDPVVDAIDPEVRSLLRVRLATWSKVGVVAVWLGTLSAGVHANSTAIATKADKAVVDSNRHTDLEVLRGRLDTIIAHEQAQADRLTKIEEFQRQQVQLALEAQMKTK